MVRTMTEDDLGLKVMAGGDDDGSDADVVDVVAIHGIGAHADETWTKNRGTKEKPNYVNWLSDKLMLPSALPKARMLRYGYESAWFGQNAIQTRTTTVAKRFLIALNRERKRSRGRPLIFIAHCFGGLVVLKTLLEARDDVAGSSELLKSTIGICFFGTPFRGAGGLSLVELLQAARAEYDDTHIHTEVLRILEPGNEFLQDLVDRFLKMRSAQMEICKIACFYELKASNVGAIVGGKSRTRFVVDESSGCLDSSTFTEKYSLSRTHFDMNKFAKPTEEDFLTVKDVIASFICVS